MLCTMYTEAFEVTALRHITDNFIGPISFFN